MIRHTVAYRNKVNREAGCKVETMNRKERMALFLEDLPPQLIVKKADQHGFIRPDLSIYMISAATGGKLLIGLVEFLRDVRDLKNPDLYDRLQTYKETARGLRVPLYIIYNRKTYNGAVCALHRRAWTRNKLMKKPKLPRDPGQRIKEELDAIYKRESRERTRFSKKTHYFDKDLGWIRRDPTPAADSRKPQLPSFPDAIPNERGQLMYDDYPYGWAYVPKWAREYKE